MLWIPSVARHERGAGWRSRRRDGYRLSVPTAVADLSSDHAQYGQQQYETGGGHGIGEYGFGFVVSAAGIEEPRSEVALFVEAFRGGVVRRPR